MTILQSVSNQSFHFHVIQVSYILVKRVHPPFLEHAIRFHLSAFLHTGNFPGMPPSLFLLSIVQVCVQISHFSKVFCHCASKVSCYQRFTLPDAANHTYILLLHYLYLECNSILFLLPGTHTDKSKVAKAN